MSFATGCHIWTLFLNSIRLRHSRRSEGRAERTQIWDSDRGWRRWWLSPVPGVRVKNSPLLSFWYLGDMAAAIASGLIRQKRQAREQHLDRPSTNRRRKSPNKNKGLCNGNLVDIFSKVRIFGLKKRRLRRQGVGWWHLHIKMLFYFILFYLFYLSKYSILSTLFFVVLFFK